MEEKLRNTETRIQWHPAFYAGIQIELKEDADNLFFVSEHQLGTMPKEIDVLVIKKEDDRPIRKNIGRIFRKYNIVEYKHPDEYFNIDDYYKVYGYTCFFKSDVKTTNSIPVKDITITIVCRHYTKELKKHLTEECGYTISREEVGIYYIKGNRFPIQIIITNELAEEENLWLKYLTNDIRDKDTVDKLVQNYSLYKDNILYKSVMDVIVRANKEQFEEVRYMCEALEELFKDRFDEIREQATEEGREKGLAEGRVIGNIETLNEMGSTREDAAQKILFKFNLSIDEVEKYMKLYWK